MEMMEEGKDCYFIVTRAKKGKGFARGSIGRVEGETESGDLIGLLYGRGSAKKTVMVRREDTYPLSRHQAQLLQFVSPASLRLEVLCNVTLFSAICELALDDLVVVRYKNGFQLCLVKNLVQVGQTDSPKDLQMLAFELELVNPEQKVLMKKPDSLPFFSALDIVQVAPGFNLNRQPLKDGNTTVLSKKMSGVFSIPTFFHSGKTGNKKSTREISSAQTPSQHSVEVGSLVEAMCGDKLVYGLIRWIGVPKGKKNCWAGLELENVTTSSDGTLGGKRYFSCEGNRALFVPLDQCNPDGRFLSTPLPDGLLTPPETPPLTPLEDLDECFPPVVESEALCLLVGRMKGIQGHLNSCYLDTSLFSLFCSSAVLDGALHSQANADVDVSGTLRRDIVNPLRRHGFVPAENVMKLRQQLGCGSFLTEEKDPEEFITILLEKVLHMEPLLKIRSNQELSQEAYTHQIIVEKSRMRVTPTVQQLLEMSFISSQLKFEEIPSCLMVQMPRFGKTFKMFPHIIPSTELDITDLLHGSQRECFICGQTAAYECTQCIEDSKLQPGRIKQYCSTCSTQVHTHPSRHTHGPQPIPGAELFPKDQPVQRQRMQLFAVLCINTSHYVSFVKYGPDPKSWLFFDSMADRCGDENNGHNVPVVRPCPEVGGFLCQSEEELSRADVSRSGELVRRLLCDSYLCLYQHTDSLEKSLICAE